ncbi:hypothetical protein SpCBS45565_g01147 [Spizellomyces sp. 'palustris']|nr:hypothetical protein SpCBS45565_g01147 [Spizellomyces sp. 'palustris']
MYAPPQAYGQPIPPQVYPPAYSQPIQQQTVYATPQPNYVPQPIYAAQPAMTQIGVVTALPTTNVGFFAVCIGFLNMDPYLESLVTLN